MAPSDRLREIDMYAGLPFDDVDGDSLMALLDNRERRVRGEQGTNYLTKAPKVTKGPTANIFELTSGSFAGVSNQRPVFQLSSANLSLEEISDGANQGNSVITSGPGFSRLMVVTVEWTAIRYDERKDDNGQTVYLLTDEGVKYRIFSSTESLTPTIPTADLDAALASQGSIPIAVVQRSFGESEIGVDKIFPYETFVQHIRSTTEAVRTMTAAMLSHFPAAWIRRMPVLPSAVEDDLRKISMSTVADANGGKVFLDSGSDLYMVGIDGRARWFVPDDDPFSTDDLDVSSTYFLRMQITDYDRLIFYVQKGTTPVATGNTYDAIPASLKGTPNAATGGAFPSTSRDLLLGIITTGLAGTIPTWQPLLSGDFTFEFSVGYSLTPLKVPLTFLTPFACDYDIRIEFSDANYTPTGPTGAHKAFTPLGSKVLFYSWLGAEVEAKGRWLEEVAGNLQIPGADEIARPGYRVVVRPKYRTIT